MHKITSFKEKHWEIKENRLFEWTEFRFDEMNESWKVISWFIKD
jgi:hypothetical protein